MHTVRPEPYSYSNGQWTISAAGRTSSTTWRVDPPSSLHSSSSTSRTGSTRSRARRAHAARCQQRTCGASGRRFNQFGRAQESTTTSASRALGRPAGTLYNSYSCIGNKYADQSGVADYVGVWDYPFEAGGYQEARALSTLNRETNYVINSMHAVPVWLNQSHAASCCSLVFPTKAQILEWNCSVRAALPAGSLISWYVWRQGIYSDTLSAHPEDWTSTTAAACP